MIFKSVKFYTRLKRALVHFRRTTYSYKKANFFRDQHP